MDLERSVGTRHRVIQCLHDHHRGAPDWRATGRRDHTAPQGPRVPPSGSPHDQNGMPWTVTRLQTQRKKDLSQDRTRLRRAWFNSHADTLIDDRRTEYQVETVLLELLENVDQRAAVVERTVGRAENRFATEQEEHTGGEHCQNTPPLPDVHDKLFFLQMRLYARLGDCVK